MNLFILAHFRFCKDKKQKNSNGAASKAGTTVIPNCSVALFLAMTAKWLILPFETAWNALQ